MYRRCRESEGYIIVTLGEMLREQDFFHPSREPYSWTLTQIDFEEQQPMVEIALLNTRQIFLGSQIKASSPFLSRRLRSFSDGPLGCLAPISHCRIVEGLVLRTDASTV